MVEGKKQKKEDQQPRASSPASRKRKHDDESENEDLVDADLNPIRPSTPARKEKRQLDRTPSTSPPPAPPDVEYMHEGANGDDKWAMVEDEFLSTAKMFTQHIHHAEYVRLKKLARSRGAGTLRAISRPTDGRTEQSNALRMRLEAGERVRKRQDGMKDIGDDEESSEGEDAYMLDPQLAGLMTTEKSRGKDLSSFAKAKSNTRAAAGFSQSPGNVERKKNALASTSTSRDGHTLGKTRKVFEEEAFSEDDEVEDLDAAPAQPTKPSFVHSDGPKRAVYHTHEANPRKGQATKPRDTGLFKRFAQASHTETPVEERKGRHIPASTERKDETADSSTHRRTSSVSFNSEPVTRNEQSSAALEYLAKRKADKEKKEREQRRKAKLADDVPTFLI